MEKERKKERKKERWKTPLASFFLSVSLIIRDAPKGKWEENIAKLGLLLEYVPIKL